MSGSWFVVKYLMEKRLTSRDDHLSARLSIGLPVTGRSVQEQQRSAMHARQLISTLTGRVSNGQGVTVLKNVQKQNLG